MPEWRQLTSVNNTYPPARSSHSVSCVMDYEKGDKIYVFGGEHEPRVPMGSDMWCYDLQKETWEKLEVTGVAPEARVAHSAAVVGGVIYIFGGRTALADACALNDMYAFDTHTRTWTTVHTHDATSTHIPPPRSYHAVSVLKTNIYLFGGCGQEGRLNDLWRFDTQTRTWSQLATGECIKGRGGPGFTAMGIHLYVLGGFSGEERGDVHIYDTLKDTWVCGCVKVGETYTHKHNIPPRSVFVADAHVCGGVAGEVCENDGCIFTFGGEVDPSTQGHAGAGEYSCETLCVQTNIHTNTLVCQKVHTPTHPEARGWHAGCVCARGLVIHGGNSLKNERLGDMWLLDMHC
eukprot:GDKI01024293.1.p1 GENE.GDKI01024293.1~~GDKI01024293.1.p1  ORF type:complete len:374 (-),score=113.52 GDKI01024293.1:105-1145(-)